MAKQMIKGATMLVLLAALSLATAVASAKGQTSNRLRATVPFEFVAGDQTLTAGTYEVANNAAASATVTIRSTTTSKAIFQSTNVMVKANPAKMSKLVFHRYGNTYFLAEIWRVGDTNGTQLRKSSGEKALEQQIGANRSKRYERVDVALVR